LSHPEIGELDFHIHVPACHWLRVITGKCEFPYSSRAVLQKKYTSVAVAMGRVHSSSHSEAEVPHHGLLLVTFLSLQVIKITGDTMIQTVLLTPCPVLADTLPAAS
jgi:hypothetical protein